MKAPQAPPLPDEVTALLRRLRVPYMRKAAPEVCATARAQRWDPAEILRVLLAEEVAPCVPAPVLAQAWRGGPRQANIARLLAMCEVEPMSVDQARKVGVLVGRSGHDDVVDVAVVEGAIRRGDAVVTSNRDHIARVGRAARVKLRIEDV